MNSPSAPTPPDPTKTAAAQTKSNVGTAVANSYIGNANERSVLGNVDYKITGYNNVGGQKVPTFTRTTTLSPEQQQLYDQQTKIGAQSNDIAGTELDQLKSSLSQPLNYDGLPEAPAYDRQHYEDALNNRLEPQLERDRAATESRLANQGIMPGSEAYREALALQDRGRNDARTNSILSAGNYAGQEQAAGYQARDHAIQERTQLRSQPINEIGALMSHGQVSMPQFANYRGGQVAGTDVAGITQNGFNNQMGLYNSQVSQNNAMMGGLAGLGGALVAAPMTGGSSVGGALFKGFGP